MNGREFEVFMSLVFKELGYKVTLTKQTNDYGRDIIIRTDNETIFVECKRYSESSEGGFLIGREIVQKLSGSMTMFNANKGLVVTTGCYHKNAIEAADMIGNIELWDMSQIMKCVVKINQKRIPYILNRTIGSHMKIIRLKPNIG
jgi:restriction system protein